MRKSGVSPFGRTISEYAWRHLKKSTAWIPESADRVSQPNFGPEIETDHICLDPKNRHLQIVKLPA